MNTIHIGESYIVAIKNSKPGPIVVTLKGLLAVIARGSGPGIIDGMTLTPAAAKYWSDYKIKTFPSEQNKSYPLD